ncbi:hypothetical protein ASG87_01125 [Frateuria sp. Soil773]|nr:hypothetical protein ASG87_01125 [Frateuria sp. Soil773]
MRRLILCCALPMAACTATRAGDAAQPSVTLQRTTCFGSCPAYAVTVSPDGRVSFEGQMHVQAKSASARVDAGRYAAILAAVRQAGLESMRDNYVAHGNGCDQVATDMPSIRIALAGARTKSVYFYLGCSGQEADAVRPRIEELARTIDQQLDTARWIGQGSASPVSVQR